VDLRREIDRLLSDLFHVDQVLKLYGEEPGDIPTKGRMPKHQPIRPKRDHASVL